jgi:hypothetical protein
MPEFGEKGKENFTSVRVFCPNFQSSLSEKVTKADEDQKTTANLPNAGSYEVELQVWAKLGSRVVLSNRGEYHKVSVT